MAPDFSRQARRSSPAVTIGLPVYNGAQTLRRALESLLSQGWKDFELIISDNCSTDDTEAICTEFALKDSRVRYVRQGRNLGSAANFAFVLSQAEAPYFMWAAADDFWSPDFIDVNLAFLRTHPDYVGSTSPNFHEGQEDEPEHLVNHALSGSIDSRMLAFMKRPGKSHGFFYALMRTDVVRNCPMIGKSFTAADWAIILYLCAHGPINRVSSGSLVLGENGISKSASAWRAFRSEPIELLIPLYRFSRYAIRLTRTLPLRGRIKFLWNLALWNAFASYVQARTEIRNLLLPMLARFSSKYALLQQELMINAGGVFKGDCGLGSDAESKDSVGFDGKR